MMPRYVLIRTVIIASICAAAPIALSLFALIDGVSYIERGILFTLAAVWTLGCLFLVYIFLPQSDGWLRRMRRKHSGRRIAVLTFDDGPDAGTTEQALSILKDKGVGAAFFVLGDKVRRNGDIVRKIAEAGHDIGNHTTSHRKLVLRSKSDIAEDIRTTSNAIFEHTGSAPTLFRSPHGFRRPGLKRLLHGLRLELIPWTKGIWDTDGSDADTLFKRFTKKFSNFELLLLHDGVDASLTSKDRSATLGALPRIIDEYHRRGYEFRKISEL